MSDCTLLLTPQMTPHRVVSWQKAVVLLFLGKLEVLEEYDVPIRSPRLVLRTPAVCRLVRSGGYLRRPIAYSRSNILLRDGFRCQYCGARKAASELNQDHVLPRARGGPASWENIVASCYACNQKKGNRTPEEAGMKLLRRPFRPRWLAPQGFREGANVPGEWVPYLAAAGLSPVFSRGRSEPAEALGAASTVPCRGVVLAARILRVSAAVSFVFVGLAACELDPSGVEGSRDYEQEPTGETSSELVSYDCGTRTDTGYTNGNAFTITVVTVDGKPVERDTANAFLTMAKAAEGSGIQLRINSGFRTNDEQKYLYNCYLTGNCNNGNLAAKPGYSNHQSGHALDLNTGGGALNWLNAHGGSYGFKRTVPSENWHWEWWGGGPIQAYCPTCKDECQGNVLARANCEKIDCGAQGASCVHDGGGLRCVCKEECQGNVLVRSSCQRTDCGATGSACVTNGGLRCDALPRGSLDAANAASISGWAQDPSIATEAIDAHVYFGGPAGAPNAVGRPVKADDPRSDLCGAIGSCNHAFSLRTPRSLLDDAPHPVHAYGIDGSGAPNAELGNSPRTLREPPPDIAPGTVLRRVPNDAVFQAWRFSAFDDVAPMPDASAKIGAWRDTATLPLPTAPELVQGDDATGSVWLLDSGVRRRVPNPVEWRFGPAKILRAAELFAIPQGAPLPERPLLVRDVGPVDYVLDVPFQPTGDEVYPDGDPIEGGRGGGKGTGPSGASGEGAGPAGLTPAAAEGSDGAGSCAYGPIATGRTGVGASALLVCALALVARRRR